MKMPEYITKEQAISVVTASTDYDEEWLVEDPMCIHQTDSNVLNAALSLKTTRNARTKKAIHGLSSRPGIIALVAAQEWKVKNNDQP